MECYMLQARSTVGIIGQLLFASTVGLEPTKQVKQMKLSSKRPLEVQFDGEVVTLDGGEVSVSVVKDAIKTLK